MVKFHACCLKTGGIRTPKSRHIPLRVWFLIAIANSVEINTKTFFRLLSSRLLKLFFISNFSFFNCKGLLLSSRLEVNVTNDLIAQSPLKDESSTWKRFLIYQGSTAQKIFHYWISALKACTVSLFWKAP